VCVFVVVSRGECLCASGRRDARACTCIINRRHSFKRMTARGVKGRLDGAGRKEERGGRQRRNKNTLVVDPLIL